MKLDNEEFAHIKCAEGFSEKLRFVSTAEGTVCEGHICDLCINNAGEFSIFGKNPNICCFEKTERCFNGIPYYIFVNRDISNVVVFSKFCIPFNIPKAKSQFLKNYKNDLIKAIRNIRPFDNCILQAKYGTTESKKNYDLENVLFYNIGTTHFKLFTNKGVKFSVATNQEINKLRKQYNIPDEYTHYYEYRIETNTPKKISGDLLAEWEDIPLKCLGARPANIWNILRIYEKTIKVYDKIDCNKGDTFALVLNIEKPKGTRLNIMTAMKPLLDGLICAFHSSNFNENELEYFSQHLSCGKEFLSDNSVNVLGKRNSKFIQIYRNNIKWNPADDLCNYVFISIRENNAWNVSGKIYSSVKCPKCGKGKISKLLWGMPAYSEELEKDIELGKVRLAGCVINEKRHRYYCKWCKQEF